jgi:hypothetical protein
VLVRLVTLLNWRLQDSQLNSTSIAMGQNRQETPSTLRYAAAAVAAAGCV